MNDSSDRLRQTQADTSDETFSRADLRGETPRAGYVACDLNENAPEARLPLLLRLYFRGSRYRRSRPQGRPNIERESRQVVDTKLRAMYDGRTGDEPIMAAVMSGRAPFVEIFDPAAAKVLASGNPCINDARNLREALDFIQTRTAQLQRKALDLPQPRDPAVCHSPPNLTNALVLKWLGWRLARRAVREVYSRLFHTPQWCVGYRIVSGDGVMERGSLAGQPWRLIPAEDGHFYADPFPIIVGGERFIFFEDLDHRTYKGTVSYVRLDKDGNPGPVTPALEERVHLSYPFLFEEDGEIYMVPEQGAAREVVLYRAAPFPDTWVRDTVLISNVDASDASIVKVDDRYWMFATLQEGASPSDMMVAYFADQLRGPWTPHPHNPILIDKGSARPAGSMILREKKLWRATQDCTYGYGSGVSLVELTELTPERIVQRVDRKIWPGSDAWWGHRLHTLTRAGDVECIDGAGLAGRTWLTRKLAAIPAIRRAMLR